MDCLLLKTCSCFFTRSELRRPCTVLHLLTVKQPKGSTHTHTQKRKYIALQNINGFRQYWFSSTLSLVCPQVCYDIFLIWFGAASAQAKRKLQCIIHSSEKITGCSRLSNCESCNYRLQNDVENISACLSHLTARHSNSLSLRRLNLY